MKVKVWSNLSLLFLVHLLDSPVFTNAKFSKSKSEYQEIQRNQFPDGFLFGASTSAYQVEGGYREDGKTLSNWDVFSHVPGKIFNNDNGDFADDHYHRYLEDIELIHSLGTNAYRFSISWTRILPSGKYGGVNSKGIAFYSKIIDNLLLQGIEPFVTIFHWDLPQTLEEKYGGWLNPLIREEFLHYATLCFEEFGDRVKYWIIINEPMHLANFAYQRGDYPPSRCSHPFGNCSAGNSDTEPLIALHNLVLSYAMAADIYRNRFQVKQGGFIGIAVNAFMYEPFRDVEDDRRAVDRALAFNIAWALDPIIYGDYPKEMRECKGLHHLPKFSEKEKDLLLRASVDFIGVNHYTTLYAQDCLFSPCSAVANRPIRGFVQTSGYRDGVPIGQPTGMNNFFVVPRGTEKIIDYISKRYNNKPMFITENGFASPILQTKRQLIEDRDRINFHKAHLSALATAIRLYIIIVQAFIFIDLDLNSGNKVIRNGGDVRGLFIWSLMDNFEWTSGYSVRFGLYYVDRHSLQRTPKLSAKWFARFLSNFTATPNQVGLITDSQPYKPLIS